MKNKLVLPCLRGVVGKWVYYSTLMTAGQIAEWVKPVKEIRESEALEDVLQRKLKERKKAIAKYLINEEYRFFNSIIVGVWGGMPDWIEFDLAKVRDYFPIHEEEYLEKSVGIMVFSGEEELFAIDGQHRVAGITIAHQEDENRILKDDQFSVILIAHVDDEMGKKRTRKLFSDINKHAKPVSGGDKVIIDEEDICAIVARRIFAQYPHFDKGKKIDPAEEANLRQGDIEYFTNLLAIYKVVQLLKNKLFKKQPGSKDWEENNIGNLKEITEEFLNFIIQNLPEYKQYFIDKSLTLAEARRENRHILFRPIGLFLITKLYAHFKKQGAQSFDQFEDKIPLINFTMPESPLKNILWSSGRMETRSTHQTLAFDLCRYLLGDFPVHNEGDLLKKYRELTKNETAQLPSKLNT